MKLTGLFIARQVEMVGGEYPEINVTGGVVNRVLIPPLSDYPDGVGLNLVLLYQPSDEDHNQPFLMTLDVVTPDGSVHRMNDEIVTVGPLGSTLFLVTPITGLRPTRSGVLRYVYSTKGSEPVSVALEVVTMDDLLSEG